MPRLGSGIPLVARGAEMDRLRAALDRADRGTASAVLVSGDAGVGKSRLLDELGRQATTGGALVLTGRCLDVGETGLPYLPFVEMLAELQRADPAVVAARPALGRLLPGSADVPAPPEPVSVSPLPGRRSTPERDLGQLQLFDAVAGALGELADRRCVVLLVEDLHWADSSTRDLLSYLLSRLRAQRLLVLASYRADDLHRRHPLRPLLAELVRLPAVERIELAPFADQDARAFVAALADDPLPDDIVRQIADRSEGNAFFAEELVAACVAGDDGLPGGVRDYGVDGMPTALADVLLARIERLSPAAQNLVRLASVAGRRVRHVRLQAVAEQLGVELDEALREAVQHYVLLVDDRADAYAFRHALLREAVYGDLLPGERVRLHAAYARQIAAAENLRGSAAALAHHSLQSHDLSTALAASVRAADEAKDLGAPAEALRHIEEALKLWDAVVADERPANVTEAKLLRLASYLAGTAGEPERALAFARSAVDRFDETETPEQTAESYRRLAQALMNMDGKGGESGEAIEHAWQLVADRPPTYIRAWVQSIRAATLRKRDPEKARQAALEAISNARSMGLGGPEADALATLGLVDEYDGKLDQAVRHFTEAVSRAAEANALTTELRARYFLGVHSYDQGDTDTAATVFEQAIARARENGLGWSSYAVELRVMQAVSKYMSGNWDGPHEWSEPPNRRVSDTVLARMSSAGMFVMVARGRFEDAERLLGELRAHWHRDWEIVAHNSFCAAELGLWQGNPDRAAQSVTDALAWARRSSWPWVLSGIRLAAWGVAAQVELARRARRDRDVDAEHAAVVEADRLVEHAEQVNENGHPWTGQLGPEGRAWLAMVHAERSRLDGVGEPAAWRATVEAFGYGNVYQQAIARWRYAEVLVGVDARDQAIEQLRLAGAAASTLGARPLLTAVTELARRARLTVPGLVIGRDHVDPFTPRERAVLTLVAQGRTNREVGDELFISEKTVSVHLSRIMAKLGASRRAEAVAAAYERGLLEAGS